MYNTACAIHPGLPDIQINEKQRNRHQHNTDDGGQAMGEEMRHAQMSRWGKHIGEESKQQ